MPKQYRKMDMPQVLLGLQEVAASDTKYSPKAQGLMGWYRERGELTAKQRAFAVNMIFEVRRRKQRATATKDRSYWLYAIDDGVYIKIGHSSNPKGRLAQMQTGHPQKMELLWTASAGQVKALAEKAEKQLHRYCKKYRVRGEWFHRDCMTLVRQFSIKRMVEAERKEELAEMEIVCEAVQRI